jgi:hypothetical protein
MQSEISSKTLTYVANYCKLWKYQIIPTNPFECEWLGLNVQLQTRRIFTGINRSFEMKTVLLLVSMLYACATQHRSIVNCIPCNIEAISTADKKIDSLNKEQIQAFLCTIKSDCKLNVEFAEYSNGVLFKILDRKTQTFVDAFSEIELEDKEYLLDVIASPILDYNVQKLILKIETSNGNEETKTTLLNALRKAERKR